MTMDIAQQEREDMKMLSPRLTCEIQNKDGLLPQTKPTSVKRSFDVAFLMLPDEKLKNKHPEPKTSAPTLGCDRNISAATQCEK